MLSSPEIIKEKDQLQIESPVNHKKQKDNFLVFLSATHDEEELFNSWKVIFLLNFLFFYFPSTKICLFILIYLFIYLFFDLLF